MTMRSINPANGIVTAEFEPNTEAQIEAAVARSQQAFERHRRTTFASRAHCLLDVANALTEDKQRWGRLLTEEMGKTLAAAISEVEKCAWVCRYYAEHAEDFLHDVPMTSDAARSFVTHAPLGPILAVMPWNFPFWQVFRFAAPAVMAGNVVLLKHASNVPRAALALQDIFANTGLEPGVFQTLLVESAAVAGILKDRRIKAATVTGSVRAGSSVAAVAGKHVKKTVLELGGSDAFIVLPSADLEQALEVGVTSRTLNNGQSCIAAKRFIIHADIYATFVEAFVERFDRLTVGDPLDSETDVGPLAMARTRERLEEQIAASVDKGARILTGAHSIEGPGNFFRPGVLSDIGAEAPVYRDEVFGPVALVFEAHGLDQAIALANDSPYGLAAAVWTQDEEEAKRAIREIDAGAVFVNSLVKSDPRLPFGGIKSSGYGRELSTHGILEFVNRKTVSIG